VVVVVKKETGYRKIGIGFKPYPVDTEQEALHLNQAWFGLSVRKGLNSLLLLQSPFLGFPLPQQ
jgi:hypothetical protein